MVSYEHQGEGEQDSGKDPAQPNYKKKEIVSEKALQLYSNYVMTKEILSADSIFYQDGPEKEVSLHVQKSKDLHNPDDIDSRESSAIVCLTLDGSFDFERFNDNIERIIEDNNMPIVDSEQRLPFKRYSFWEQEHVCPYRIEIDRYETMDKNITPQMIRRMEFSVMIDPRNEDPVITTDNAIHAMNDFREAIEEEGLDWQEALNSFFSLDIDHLLYESRIEEVPRDFWEDPRDVWKRLGESEISSYIDTFLDIYKDARSKGDDQRALYAEQSLEFLEKLTRK